jgi:carbamoyl-phosphate synthase large subunit
MEHIETAGVHSGDSACMIPPRSLSREVNRRVREVTEDIARALDTVGLLNVQLAVKDGEVYVLEANPRSSRTVPFVSKATGVPIAKIAAKVMAGASLEELGYEEQIPEQVSVKEVVLPFDRLPGSDPRLGPEMKSTGEVMGTADTFGKAYQKAQMCVGKPIPLEGTAIVDMPVAGFEDFFDVREFEDYDSLAAVEDAIRDGEVDLVISRERDVLEVCVEETVTYFSTVESAQAALEAIRHSGEPLDVAPVSDRPKMQEYWGQPAEREDLRAGVETLRTVAESGYLEALGASDDSLADLVEGLDAVGETIDRSVLLMGTGEGVADDDLATVQDALADRGYEARLAGDLPVDADRTTEQNRAVYMMLSKFSILVDRDPSQRLAEYETAKAHDNVLALLVPADSERQHTHVIGGHADGDADHVREFTFEDDPSEVLDDAVEWAERVVAERQATYRERLPWRGE